MPIVKVEDGTGETVRVLDVDGYYTPTFDEVVSTEVIQKQEQVFRTITDWKVKSDDVFICAYPKAGTHWLWEVSSMLVNQSADRVKLVKETSMVEGVNMEMFDNVASPRVLNTHLPLRLLPKNLLKQNAKIIFVQRNPKDICVSFYNHHKKICEYEYDGKWENYTERFLKGLVKLLDMKIHSKAIDIHIRQLIAWCYHVCIKVDYGSWFEYTLNWEKVFNDNPDYPFYVMSYEDMKTDSVKEIQKLSEFLGLKSDQALIEEIAEKCEFSNMKKEKDPLEDSSGWKDGKPGMYRKGQIGDWKNWFTVAQNERFDAVFADKMDKSSFTYRYS